MPEAVSGSGDGDGGGAADGAGNTDGAGRKVKGRGKAGNCKSSLAQSCVSVCYSALA
jgi:hypothetical protein